MLKRGDTLTCVDDSLNATHSGNFPILIGEKVEFVEYVGCCIKVKKIENEETYILSKSRFYECD